MARLSDVEVFVSVVESGGFSAAARRHGVTQSAVSRRVAALEARLGARLLVRSTRRFALSAQGRRYYERCRRLLAEFDDAEQEVMAGSSTPRGTLRIAAPPLFARRVLTPRLGSFLQAHPDVTVDLVLADRYVDLLEEGFELAIRHLTPSAGGTLVARRVGFFRMVACCAPAYLRGRTAPAHPRDLAGHACLTHTALTTRDEWAFDGPDGEHTVRVAGPLRTNDMEALCEGARAGLGVAVLPSYAIAPDLAAGRLRTLLDAFTLPRMKIWAVHPGRKHRSARLRAFLDWLVTTVVDAEEGAP